MSLVATSSSRAATDLGPASPAEADLCARGSRVDWPYLGALALADAGSVVLDSQTLQGSAQAGVRMVGPALVGLTWGWTVGAFTMTLPQCSPRWLGALPPEGETRSRWPLAVSFSVLAAALGPVVIGLETGEGSSTLAWSPGERVSRLVVAGAAGLVGSLLPYALPPAPYRAMRALSHLRAGGDAHGAVVSYAAAF